MAEIRFGMIANICFNLFPVAAVITDLFTDGAYRQKAAQGFDFGNVLSNTNKALEFLVLSIYDAAGKIGNVIS